MTSSPFYLTIKQCITRLFTLKGLKVGIEVGRMERRQERKLARKGGWNKLLSTGLVRKLIVVGIAAFLIGLLIFNIFIWTSDVSKLEKPVPQPTIIYD